MCHYINIRLDKVWNYSHTNSCSLSEILKYSKRALFDLPGALDAIFTRNDRDALWVDDLKTSLRNSDRK